MSDIINISLGNMARNLSGPVNEKSYGKEMIAALDKHTTQITSAIKNKTELRIYGSHAAAIAMWKHGEWFTTYSREQTQF